MNNENNIEKAFYLCEDNLANLPSKYKKWDKLNKYRNDWSFIENIEVRDRIAEQRMACDYLLSLYLWLKPGLTLYDAHRHLLIQILGSIYEGVLIDLLNKKAKKMTDDKLAKSLLKKVNIDKLNFYDLIKIANKGEMLDKYWEKYLSEIREIRNWIHLSKRKKANISLLQKTLEEFISDLDEFRKFMRGKFQKLSAVSTEDIPF